MPARWRKPMIQTGNVPSRIRELTNYTAGGSRFVVLKFEGAEEDIDILRDTLLEKRKGQHGGLNLKGHARAAAACAAGSGATGSTISRRRNTPRTWARPAR